MRVAHTTNRRNGSNSLDSASLLNLIYFSCWSDGSHVNPTHETDISNEWDPMNEMDSDCIQTRNSPGARHLWYHDAYPWKEIGFHRPANLLSLQLNGTKPTIQLKVSKYTEPTSVRWFLRDHASPRTLQSQNLATSVFPHKVCFGVPSPMKARGMNIHDFNILLWKNWKQRENFPLGRLPFYTDGDESALTCARQLSIGLGWGKYLVAHPGLSRSSLPHVQPEGHYQMTALVNWISI